MGTDKNRTMQSPKGHTSKEKFDLIVIGSGSGRDVANAAAQFGLKVAIVEKGRMGGTCLNRGCIPSKMLLHSADVAEVIKNAGKFGVNVDKYTVDFKKIVRRVNRIVDSDSTEIKKALSGVENPRLFPVQCRFIGPKTIAAGDDGAVITAKKILIASGARPAIPKIRGLNGSGYITSDEALRLDKQPRVLTIIGGGYIAAELAHFFGALGTKVNIIQSRNVLIPDEDEKVSRKFTDIFARKYNVYLGYTIKFVEKRGTRRHGVFVVTIRDAEGKVVKLKSDQLLVATGRIPNSDTLDLRRTGVEVNDAGFIKTDGYLETNVKGIFALGDAIGNYMLKHSANYEAQYAFNNIIKGVHHHKVDYTAMPHAIFSSPQVAAVGRTEQELKKEKVKYDRTVYPYIKTAMGEAIQETEGFVKFLVEERTGKILGCHIMGAEASILIHEVLVAMRAGSGTLKDIQRTIHIHPALSEVVSRAAGGGEG